MASIRWRKKDLEKLSTYVRKFNASITRFEKQNPDYSGFQIPERLAVDSLKKRIKTRADFNYHMNKIDRWFKPGMREIVNYNGIFTTKWDKISTQVALKRQKQIINKLQSEYSTSPSINREAGLYERNAESKINEIKSKMAKNSKNPFSKYEISNGLKAWRNFQKEVEKMGSAQFRDDFKFKVFGAYKKSIITIFTLEQSKLILDKLNELNITPSELMVMRKNYDIFDIDFIYGPEEVEEKFNLIMEYIDVALEDIRNDNDSGF